MRVLFYTLVLSLVLLAWPVKAEEPAAASPPGAEHGAAHDLTDAHADGAADSAEGHGDTHGSGGLPQLNPAVYPTQIFWLLVTFAAMYALFSKGSLPAISGVIENRRQHIDSDLEAAEKLRSEAERIQAAYEESLGVAREKAAAAFLEVENGMKDKSAAQLKAFQEKSAAQLSSAEKSVAAAKAAAMEDMSALAAEIARKAAEKIIGVETDIKQAKDMVKSIHDSKAKAA